MKRTSVHLQTSMYVQPLHEDNDPEARLPPSRQRWQQRTVAMVTCKAHVPPATKSPWAAAGLLGAVQTVAALFSARGSTVTWLGYALIGLMVLFGLCFWQSPLSGLSVAAMTLIALGRMQSNDLRLRLLLLAGGVAWVIHDTAAQAWFALAADLGALLMGAVTLIALHLRVTVEWRVPSATTSPVDQAAC